MLNLEGNKNIYEYVAGNAFALDKWISDESKLFKIAEDLKRTDSDDSNLHKKQLIKLVTDLHSYDSQLSKEVAKMKSRFILAYII